MYPQPPPINPERLAYSPNYDKELYDAIRTEMSRVYNILVAEARTQPYLQDPEGLGRISGLLNDMKMLLLTYKEKIPELDDLELELLFMKTYPLQDTAQKKGLLKQFIFIRDQFITIMAHKHNFKDKTEHKEPWEDQIKKKYRLPELKGEYLDWFNEYTSPAPGHCWYWKRIAFYWTQYCVQRKGDVHCLVSGINDSGKTNTIIPMLRFANKCFRECWHVYENDKQTIELHKFSLDKDVIYDADPSMLNEYLSADKYYQTVDATEGMGTGTNLESMNKQVIKMGVKAYRIRAHHSIFAYEYQVENRPPKLLQQRFNGWIKKMDWEHAVYSAPSAFYRTKDPLYLKRLEDIADNDTKLARWFANRRNNPNFIVKFTAPHMSPKNQAKFDKNMQAADTRMQIAEDMQEKSTAKYFNIAKELWDKINIEHYIVEDQLSTELIDKGLNKYQIDKITNIYQEYDAKQKWDKQKKVIAQPIQ